jgi:hypothetical protein
MPPKDGINNRAVKVWRGEGVSCMERRSFVFSIVLALSLLVAGPADAVVHQINKSVGVIMPPDYRDCVFFQLVGVSVPDPGVSTSPWIAIPRSQVGFKEIYALLLWAKGSGTNITVETSGEAVASCGGAVGVWQVYTAS